MAATHSQLSHDASSDDKAIAHELVAVEDTGHTKEDAAVAAAQQKTPEEEKKILRKIDVRLVPVLAFLYLVSFIDRANIGNARVAGLEKDLKLHGMQYNVALTIMFIPYSLLEVPSNIILKMTRPSYYISILLFVWGLIVTLTGLVQSYSGLLAARWFLGTAEAGFFPAATFLLTIWYRRYEVQTRMVFFYAGATMGGAFSGLLAYAIQKMDGISGLEGWRWIFIIEGIFTSSLAFFMWRILPDRPGTASFLTPDEREFVIARLQVETGSGRGRITNDDKITKEHIFAGLREWKIWLAVLIFWGNAIGGYGFTYAIPTVILGLGYTAANAQLLTVPIYVVAMIATVLNAVISDRYKQRSPFIILGLVVAIIGTICLLAVPHPGLPGLTYGILFIAASGLYMLTIPVMCFVANNLAPSSKRAVGMALLLSIGNMGGIVGSNIFLSNQAPHYWTGYGVIMGIDCLAVVACLILRFSYKRINAERDRMSEEEIRARYTDDELLKMGDKSPFYRYTL
ncbi:hypothetical protein Z517_02742 [Fonsecaea pedrosoi CBS 271.37]|uniref:Major facilitator superfamily (MFS) profile domain-containing protein n=1 Tax=Fonsecaea pedrosoi CBS 271.37 TaxID=1442368 RepID=A0A0D2FA70_9EURO|nr:uncharacterized protein Z517_02742 [Fonsecaea pedrosoi CBS 271.37]KIW83497.1 hypothetical protein Z517_02742 [Fonsecaea pedrosoi CBS 271.37]